MKKILSAILSAVLMTSVTMPVFAENAENYEYVLPMEYSGIERLKNGYLAWINNETCALYNLKGEKISADYDYIGAFYKDDVTVAQKDGKYYVINSFGEVMSEYNNRVFNVSELVLVNLSDENEDGRPFSYYQGNFGVYNYWGELLTVLPYDDYIPSKNSGMEISFDGGRLFYKANGKWGALNLSFQTAIKPSYDKIYTFEPERCGVTMACKGVKFGLIDVNGRELTEFIYDTMERKSNGYRASIGEKYTFFDKYGNVILKDADTFVPDAYYEDYGLIDVYISNTREDSDEYPYLHGLINTDGEIVLPIEHVSQVRISDGMIAAEKSYNHAGYYDLNGNAVTNFKYRMVSPFSEGLACASCCIDGVWSHEVINKSGEVVFYTDGWVMGGFYGGISDDGKGNIINKKGEIVIKNNDWNSIAGLSRWSYNNDGCFTVSDGEMHGVVRYKGYVSPWAEDEVEKARETGITDVNNNYDYVKSITREDFCELIYNYYTLISDTPTATKVKNSFTDTDNEHVAVLKAVDIINGKSETEFAPNDLLTREEAATIIFRLIKTVHPDSAATELWYEFADSGDISDWAVDSIQRICNMGIMKGMGDNKFAPKENFTTEQAVATLVRCYENFNRSEIIGGANGETDIVVTDLSFADKLNTQMPQDKNYMFSPMSIKMALALAANGASGETQEEILNALGLSSLDEFNSVSKDLIERYSQTDILSLNIANSVWVNKDKTSQNFSKNFKKTATDYYNADVKTVDNKNAVVEINSWVSDKTNKKITEIVKDTDSFWAMLVNAIYFKGAWQNEFSESATKPDEFTSADGTKTQIDFMNRTGWMSCAETKSAKIVELPYKNTLDKFDENGDYIDTEYYGDLDVSMYVIAADNDINVAEELDAAIGDETFKRTYIKLSMPKFKIEYSESLNDMLKNIGIQTAFEPEQAQFEKMFDSGNMQFTDTIHKTFISVDEKGTEAAAVTSLSMGGSSLPPEPTELKFNKPFCFVIRDNTSGEILFIGRYAFAE